MAGTNCSHRSQTVTCTHILSGASPLQVTDTEQDVLCSLCYEAVVWRGEDISDRLLALCWPCLNNKLDRTERVQN
jgi:hypothetical protein